MIDAWLSDFDGLTRMLYEPYDHEWNLTWNEQRMTLTQWMDAWLFADIRRELSRAKRDRRRAVMARKKRRGWA